MFHASKVFIVYSWIIKKSLDSGGRVVDVFLLLQSTEERIDAL